MDRLLLLGLSHTTAPLEVRERLAFNAAQREAALAQFKARFPQCELVLLSTCNRVEFYAARAVHGTPRNEELIEFVAGFHGLSAQQFTSHLYQKADREMVGHLFHVASSLDSMVLGETQILGQVREAYDSAAQAGTAGPLLNPLFQRAIAVAKQVMHETALSEGRLSVASVAVDYARGIFDHFNDKTVLTIGAGKMAKLVLKHFKALNPGKLLVCNRDPQKAASLAAEFGGEPAAFQRLGEHLVVADIVLSSTGAQQPIITRSQFDLLRRRRRYRRIFLIDIAVPRDIEPAVGQIENVFLYNLDDLQQVVSATQAQRKDVLDAARRIIGQHVETFVGWHRQRQLGPAIRQLYERYHAIAQEELARTLNKLPNLSDAERSHLEDLSRRIVNKLLHDPVHTLRESGADHVPAAQYLHALEKLFALTPEQPPDGSDEQ
ncbi:MAG TPA: glutamyl-tRNA reductase [Tepidisphaeraceae bacterium]|nr:glutamyl-tRNA reductase [Tepidisphaeraceae bacterium]